MSFYVLFFVILRYILSETANDNVPSYDGVFTFGMNLGYQGGNWNDGTLADITLGNAQESQSGVGCNSLRLSLPETFLEEWGYQIRSSTFDHYASNGGKDMTVFLHGPAPGNEDTTTYPSCSSSSKLWRNMYEPIFDTSGGVNANNPFAQYVYKVVSEYAPRNVRFWEIINEPDFTYSSFGWQTDEPHYPNNWWANDPDPCDLTNLQAPVTAYVRLLRIAYEVVKSVDPSQYICLGGIGYSSFVDAVLRNTDNPNDGSVVSGSYPLKGGAYFDCLSFHHYPHFTVNKNNERHSDGAIRLFFESKRTHEETLSSRGYDGTNFPRKKFICTETNFPRAVSGDYFGSITSQRNFGMKLLLKSPSENVESVHFYALSTSGQDSFGYMDFYENLPSISPYNQQVEELGVGTLTVSMFTLGKTFHSARSEEIFGESEDIEGFAFYDSGNEEYVYAIWAKTNVDQSESRSLQFTFPSSIFGDFSSYMIFEWDYSSTEISTTIDVGTGGLTVDVTPDPIFIQFAGDVHSPDDDPPEEDDDVLDGGAFRYFANCFVFVLCIFVLYI